jgi:hypothetical protein
MATAAIVSTARIGTNGYAQRARWATVRIETEGAVYVGRIYVPETKKRLSDVLCDDRPFLNMTEVTIGDAEQVEPFVAVNKSFVKSVRVLNEEEAEVSFRR